MNNEKICIVVTARAPLIQIKSFINYHLNKGIDLIYLFFDDPKDKAIKEIKNYKNVIYFRNNKNSPSSIEDRQRKNANFALSLARKEGFKWICHLDIDELIWTKIELKKILRKVPNSIDYIRLATLEAVPEKLHYEDPFKGITLFKNNFHKLSKRFFRGHACGKSIVRTNAEFDCIGVHRPTPGNKKLKSRYILFNARLLHYFCYNYEDWKRKWVWRLDGTGKAKEMQPRENEYLERFKEVYNLNDEGKLINFYKKQFFVSEAKKKIFLKLKILIRLKLNKEMFFCRDSFVK
ncbi:MAG: glycosyltransferase family 2 protein [Candidatus Pacearchaeota archaeon]